MKQYLFNYDCFVEDSLLKMQFKSIFKKRKFLWYILFISYISPIYALESVILVANSSHYGLLHRIETAIYSQPPPRPQLLRLETEHLIDAQQLEKHCVKRCRLIVAVGSQATQAVLETKTSSPILSILIRKHAFDELLKNYRESHLEAPNISALYLDQPFSRQLNLLGSLLTLTQKETIIGVLLGPHSMLYESILQEKIKDYPFKLRVIKVHNQENAIAALDVLLEDVNMIWAIPDSTIYNSKTARGLLLSAFRKQVPFIGYSETYVNNGALAAVYSNPKQIATQTAEHIQKLLELPAIGTVDSIFPNTFSVAVNTQVARSIGLEIANEDVLHDQMLQQEKLGQEKMLHNSIHNLN